METNRIKAVVDDHIQPLCLRDVLYLPELEKNLLSVCAMIKLGATVLFEDGVVKIIRNSKLLATGVMRGKLYVLKMLIPDEQVNVAERSSSLQLWHYRLGHLGMDNVNKMMNEQMVDGMNSVNDEKSSVCEACIMGKQHRCPYPRGHAEHSTQPFEVVHSDVCGPMSVSSFGGSHYYVTFIDDYTRYNCVYFMKNKSEVLEKFKEFHNFATNLAGNQIKVLCSDNGGEYCSRNFDEYLKQKGITRQLTVPNNPAQNGLAERMNRTIVESARSMMFHSNLSVNFWAEAVNTAVYLKNRSPTTALDGITRYECLFNRKPDVAHLRVFGCIAFVHVPSDQRKKLDRKSRKVIFVGYPDGTKGYKLYDPVSCMFLRSRDVVFLEREFHDFDCKDSGTSVFDCMLKNHVEVEAHDNSGEQNQADQGHLEEHGEDVEPLHLNQQVGETYEENFIRNAEQLGAKRQRKPPTRFDEECYVASDLTADINEPTNIEDAFSGEHSHQWKEATKSEYDSLVGNNTWELVPLPDGKNVVGSRWVFKVKRDADGSVQRFKARLVAQGYSQSKGIDYQEVFSPVARYNSIRALFAVANTCDWDVHQMDVKTAFLQGDLDEEIFMKQPEGYIDEERPNHVCRLNKSIYGLKQAARCWNSSIDTFLLSTEYRKCTADPCVYMKSVKRQDGEIDFVIIALYVDDILLFSNNSEMLKREKLALAKRFDVEDLGELHYVLGMCVKRNRGLRTLSISQTKYLEGILKKFNVDKCKPVSTPLEAGRKFESLSEDDKPVDAKLFQMAIGCLTYAATISRPDLAAAVGVLSKFMAKPGKEHWQGIKRILRYVQGNLNYGLVFSTEGIDHTLTGYSDANWRGDLSTRRSTTGYVFQIQGSTVSWCSKRQACVSRSSTEAEYIALSTACQEGVWLRRLLSDIQIKQNGPSTVFEDNRGAIELSKNPKFHNRMKHIDVSYHYVREQVNLNIISVKYCPTEDMIADVMTKGLSKTVFEKFRNKLGVLEIKD